MKSRPKRLNIYNLCSSPQEEVPLRKGFLLISKCLQSCLRRALCNAGSNFRFAGTMLLGFVFLGFAASTDSPSRLLTVSYFSFRKSLEKPFQAGIVRILQNETDAIIVPSSIENSLRNRHVTVPQKQLRRRSHVVVRSRTLSSRTVPLANSTGMEQLRRHGTGTTTSTFKSENRTGVKGNGQKVSQMGLIAGTSMIAQFEVVVQSGESAWIGNIVAAAAGLVIASAIIVAVYRRRYLGVCQENEESDHQEAEIRESILNSLSEQVIVLDENRRLIMANESFLKAFSLSNEPAVGLSISEATSGEWDIPEIHQLLDHVIGNSYYNHTTEITKKFSHAGNRTLFLRANRFRTKTAKEDLILLAASDLTDQRDFEERNRQLDQHIRWFLEQIHDYAIFMMDTECRATTWNLGVLQVLGFDEAEFLGRDVRPLIFTTEAINAGTVDPEFEKAAARGSASDDRWMKRKDGGYFWASGTTSAIRNQTGKLVGYSKVMRDMTTQKQIGDELAGLAAQLSEESRRKNEFLAMLAHELRNPLAPIKNAVQLMGMLPISDEVEDLRNMMARQVEQLVRLIDDLMDISRIGRGKITLTKEIVDVKSIIDAAVESSQPLIRDNGQELIVSTSTQNAFLNADAARLTQVVTNLLNNASKYSDAGRRIELTTTREKEKIVIRVKDNGSGIAPDKLSDIFEMFAQAGTSTERGTAGLGIGLTLVRTLVELHGGTVKAHSDGIGLGSEFTVSILAAEASQPGGSEAVPEYDHLGRAFRILVVEDMRSLAAILARLLSKLGHEVQVVDNGHAAMEILKTYPAEVIFSDISMPGMTGYELARRLRAQASTASVELVAMTGYCQQSDREKALEAGFNEHMVKPVDIAQLQRFFAKLSLEPPRPAK
jgi:PAS domain S-box-containing protein